MWKFTFPAVVFANSCPSLTVSPSEKPLRSTAFDEYIHRLKSYAGAEELTRQMCLDLIEYFTVDAYQGRKAVRDIHIYYKLIDKPLKNKRNALEI